MRIWQFVQKVKATIIYSDVYDQMLGIVDFSSTELLKENLV